jgi:hypothetical protein
MFEEYIIKIKKDSLFGDRLHIKCEYTHGLSYSVPGASIPDRDMLSFIGSVYAVRMVNGHATELRHCITKEVPRCCLMDNGFIIHLAAEIDMQLRTVIAQHNPSGMDQISFR